MQLQLDSTTQTINNMPNYKDCLSSNTKKFGATYYTVARSDLRRLQKRDFRKKMIENLDDWLDQEELSMSGMESVDWNQVANHRLPEPVLVSHEIRVLPPSSPIRSSQPSPHLDRLLRNAKSCQIRTRQLRDNFMKKRFNQQSNHLKEETDWLKYVRNDPLPSSNARNPSTFFNSNLSAFSNVSNERLPPSNVRNDPLAPSNARNDLMASSSSSSALQPNSAATDRLSLNLSETNLPDS